MSTYLELCKDLRREVGASGTGPDAVTGQVGELEDFVQWIRKAYTSIQNRHKWRWLRHGFTFNTVQSQRSYSFGAITDVETTSAITRFHAWRLNDRWDPPKIFLTSSGIANQTWMIYSPWEHFKTIYHISSNTTIEGYPIHIAIDPLDRIELGQLPNAVYTVTGDYFLSDQVLAANSDTPEMPSQFHDLIVWYAMEHYGYKELAPEVLAHSVKMSRRMMRQLESNQLPRVRKAGALA